MMQYDRMLRLIWQNMSKLTTTIRCHSSLPREPSKPGQRSVLFSAHRHLEPLTLRTQHWCSWTRERLFYCDGFFYLFFFMFLWGLYSEQSWRSWQSLLTACPKVHTLIQTSTHSMTDVGKLRLVGHIWPTWLLNRASETVSPSPSGSCITTNPL